MLWILVSPLSQADREFTTMGLTYTRQKKLMTHAFEKPKSRGICDTLTSR
jgi:hypothetical protein